MKGPVIFLIHAYRKFNDMVVVMGLPPTTCRFTPTCSYYMEQAVEKHGVVGGVYTGIKRILRCHPFFKGGYDPVK